MFARAGAAPRRAHRQHGAPGAPRPRRDGRALGAAHGRRDGLPLPAAHRHRAVLLHRLRGHLGRLRQGAGAPRAQVAAAGPAGRDGRAVRRAGAAHRGAHRLPGERRRRARRSVAVPPRRRHARGRLRDRRRAGHGDRAAGGRRHRSDRTDAASVRYAPSITLFFGYERPITVQYPLVTPAGPGRHADRARAHVVGAGAAVRARAQGAAGHPRHRMAQRRAARARSEPRSSPSCAPTPRRSSAASPTPIGSASTRAPRAR